MLIHKCDGIGFPVLGCHGVKRSRLPVLIASRFVPVYALVLIGVFHSIMFPTIFGLSIKHLGALTKRGWSLLVMAISGGAILPDVMGRISEASNIQAAPAQNGC